MKNSIHVTGPPNMVMWSFSSFWMLPVGCTYTEGWRVWEIQYTVSHLECPGIQLVKRADPPLACCSSSFLLILLFYRLFWCSEAKDVPSISTIQFLETSLAAAAARCYQVHKEKQMSYLVQHRTVSQTVPTYEEILYQGSPFCGQHTLQKFEGHIGWIPHLA